MILHRFNYATFLLLVIVLSSFLTPVPYLPSRASSSFPVDPSGSWNPRVPCSNPWIVRISDITDNMTGSASFYNGIFSPGITSPAGDAKRWLTPGTTPQGWYSPGPPCTITNSHGQVVAVFVEIDGIKRTDITSEDCSNNYDTVNGGGQYPKKTSYCDSTFNSYDPSMVPNYSTSCEKSKDSTCYGRIHDEIDHDWKAAQYCGPSTTCDPGALSSQTTSSTLIDIQGFIYWDPDHITEQWHSFSGWEIHPLTAWRIHQSASLQATFTESGLPSGTSWKVTFKGVAYSSSTSSITISNLSSGNYSWSVQSPISGGAGIKYVASPSSGTMTLPSETTQSIVFTTQYQVTIKHSPSAGGTTYPSRKQWVNAGSTISISETPATGYAFRRWNANTSLISLSSATSSTIIATINGAGSITAYFLATVSISLSPMSGTVTAGSSTSTNVTITGGSQSVSLSVSGLPSNATVSWASNPVTDSTSGVSDTMTITTSSTTPPGTYTLIVTATGADKKISKANYTLTIT